MVNITYQKLFMCIIYFIIVFHYNCVQINGKFETAFVIKFLSFHQTWLVQSAATLVFDA